LHAIWIGAVSPKPGDAVCHIGAGTGYYTAILSVLTLPGGTVHAFEIEDGLAEKARDNLRPFEGISVVTGDATKLPLPPSDLIYVNAGVVAPPLSWLQALRPRGRMIFFMAAVARRGAGARRHARAQWFRRQTADELLFYSLRRRIGGRAMHKNAG